MFKDIPRQNIYHKIESHKNVIVFDLCPLGQELIFILISKIVRGMKLDNYLYCSINKCGEIDTHVVIN